MVTITFADDDVTLEEEISEVHGQDEPRTELSEDNSKFIFNGKPMTELTYTDLGDYEFDTVDDTEEFYHRLSLAVGFSVRRNEKRKNKDGETIGRRWVCSKQGCRSKEWVEKTDRKKPPRRITRVNCEAAFKVSMKWRTRKWVVVHFVPGHNHELTSKVHLHFLRSNRVVNNSDLAQALAMTAVGIPTRKVIETIANQSGGWHKAGFLKKDLQNRLDTARRLRMGRSDAMSAVPYMAVKIEMDPGFFFWYITDNENRLKNMFWRDSIARQDYDIFGEVVAFNAMYKSNTYRKPLVILDGVNHHYSTVIFEFALLLDETVPSYEWMLSTFYRSMSEKAPKAIITDGDPTMRKAVSTVFPNARHRLCVWHLLQNAQSHIGDESFTQLFAQCMMLSCSVDKFELRWKRLVLKFGVSDHPWIMKMDKQKHQWSKAYFRGFFCAGMRTTSRNESLNSVLKKGLHERIKLFEFVRLIDRVLEKVRFAESKLDFESASSDPVIVTHLRALEKHAATVYTRAIFEMVREEIWEEGKLILQERSEVQGRRDYIFTMFQKGHALWYASFHIVTSEIKCSCQGFETVGLPCSHSFAVMKAEQLNEMPRHLIMARWTKNTKQNQAQLMALVDVDSETMNLSRHASLRSICNKICYLASREKESYLVAKKELLDLAFRLEHLANTKLHATKLPSNTEIPIELKDPVKVKSKGAPPVRGDDKKRRLCGKCKQPGHNAQTCKTKSKEVRR